MYDQVIRNARIVGGTDKPCFDGVLAVVDDSIAAVDAVNGHCAAEVSRV